MYPRSDRRDALDLWFEMLGEMSVEDFVDELGWPSPSTMHKWIKGDPRYDPDKARYDSRPVLAKLELIRKVSEGAACAKAAREVGVSDAQAYRIVKAHAEGGTAVLLPKAATRARMRSMAGKDRRPRERAPYLDPPRVPAELPDDPEALKAIIGELQMSNAVLREVLDVLKADPGCDPASLTSREKAAVTFNLGGRFPISALCARLGMARSTYYYAVDAMTRPDARDRIASDVRGIFESEGGSARGYRFVKAVLDARLGRPVSEKVVRDSMHEQGLVVVYARARGGR